MAGKTPFLDREFPVSSTLKDVLQADNSTKTPHHICFAKYNTLLPWFPGFSWDTVNFPVSSLYGAVVWIQDVLVTQLHVCVGHSRAVLTWGQGPASSQCCPASKVPGGAPGAGRGHGRDSGPRLAHGCPIAQNLVLSQNTALEFGIIFFSTFLFPYPPLPTPSLFLPLSQPTSWIS